MFGSPNLLFVFMLKLWNTKQLFAVVCVAAIKQRVHARLTAPARSAAVSVKFVEINVKSVSGL